MTTGETNWHALRKCPVCHANTGYACEALHEGVENGRPTGLPTQLELPHKARAWRTGYVRG
jgi:hypothetical protein